VGFKSGKFEEIFRIMLSGRPILSGRGSSDTSGILSEIRQGVLIGKITWDG